MFEIPPPLDRSISVAVYGFALLKGGTPERTLASLCGSMWFWNHFAHPAILDPQSIHALKVHLVVLLATSMLALRCDRWWLLVAGMASVLSVATDCAAILLPLQRWTYGTALYTWNYIYLATLLAGTWESWRSRLTPAVGAA